MIRDWDDGPTGGGWSGGGGSGGGWELWGRGGLWTCRVSTVIFQLAAGATLVEHRGRGWLLAFVFFVLGCGALGSLEDAVRERVERARPRNRRR